MIVPKEKIKVFISSRCGIEKYDLVRHGLKSLIESTQLAVVYLFEAEGASTLSARQHYAKNLRECHLCIFLIDNKDGIGEGVQGELEEANKSNIKSLYYFCDENSKEMTHTQKGLMGAEHAKSTYVHSFKDFIDICAKDLIADLVMIYQHYCKGYIVSEDDNCNRFDNDNKDIINPTFLSEQSVKKEIINSNFMTRKYFNKLFLGFELSDEQINENNSNLLDEICSKILPVFFESQIIDNKDLQKLKKIVAEEYPENYSLVIIKRIDALYAYFSNDIKKCIEILNDCLNLAYEKGISEWIINDILIDLRNIVFWYNESKGKFIIDDKYQKSLVERKSVLYYPVIDRIHTNLFEKIIEDSIKSRTQSPYSVTIGGNLEQYSNLFANSFMISLLNGSITHLNLIYKKIKEFTFYFAERYNNGNIKMLLLKSTVINYNKKEIEEVLRIFSDVTSTMNSSEAIDLYTFTNNKPILYQRTKAKLEAFKIVAYLLSDEDFDIVWNELYKLINQWFDDNINNTSIGSHIFETLSAGYLRIPQNHIISLVIKCFERNFSRYYDDMFKMLCDNLDINTLSGEQCNLIIPFISQIIIDDQQNKIFNSFTNLLILFRKQNYELTNNFDKLIATHMKYFYNNTYKLEVLTKDDENYIDFINQNIESIKTRNETQGKNGSFLGYADNPYLTIRNIITRKNLDYSNDLIENILNCCANTLLSNTQTIREKIDSINLIIFLLGKFSEIIDDNNINLQKLNENKDILRTGSEMLENIKQTNLDFNVSLLYIKLGHDTVSEIIENVTNMHNDKMSHIMESESFLNYLQSCNDNLDTMLSHIILQNAIIWSKSDNLSVRYKATELLIELIKYPNYTSIIISQIIRLISYDAAIIKTLILGKLYLLKDLDLITYNYILKTCCADANYAVRKVALEVGK